MKNIQELNYRIQFINKFVNFLIKNQIDITKVDTFSNIFVNFLIINFKNLDERKIEDILNTIVFFEQSRLIADHSIRYNKSIEDSLKEVFNKCENNNSSEIKNYVLNKIYINLPSFYYNLLHQSYSESKKYNGDQKEYFVYLVIKEFGFDEKNYQNNFKEALLWQLKYFYNAMYVGNVNDVNFALRYILKLIENEKLSIKELKEIIEKKSEFNNLSFLSYNNFFITFFKKEDKSFKDNALLFANKLYLYMNLYENFSYLKEKLSFCKEYKEKFDQINLFFNKIFVSNSSQVKYLDQLSSYIKEIEKNIEVNNLHYEDVKEYNSDYANQESFNQLSSNVLSLLISVKNLLRSADNEKIKNSYIYFKNEYFRRINKYIFLIIDRINLYLKIDKSRLEIFLKTLNNYDEAFERFNKENFDENFKYLEHFFNQIESLLYRFNSYKFDILEGGISDNELLELSKKQITQNEILNIFLQKTKNSLKTKVKLFITNINKIIQSNDYYHFNWTNEENLRLQKLSNEFECIQKMLSAYFQGIENISKGFENISNLSDQSFKAYFEALLEINEIINNSYKEIKTLSNIEKDTSQSNYNNKVNTTLNLNEIKKVECAINNLNDFLEKKNSLYKS